MSKVLLGVCGIGHGHSFRQTPILQALIQNGHQVSIFGFGQSIKYFNEKFPQVSSNEVWVPFIHGSKTGIDFAKTATESFNTISNTYEINYSAMSKAVDQLGGEPDLIISDYEPIAAQMAYAVRKPLITIDQQSKYLGYDFEGLDGLSHLEETGRLNLFFPKAKARIACSFFDVNGETVSDDPVQIVSPMIRDQIRAVKTERNHNSTGDVVVYLSSYSFFVQKPDELLDELSRVSDKKFHVFCVNPEDYYPLLNENSNVRIYKTGDPSFEILLKTAESVICTGGHNLISELMYLSIPAYVVPLGTFEQHYNAHMVGKNGFGVKKDKIIAEEVQEFLKHKSLYHENIINDTHVLMRGQGELQIMDIINKSVTPLFDMEKTSFFSKPKFPDRNL